MLGLGNSHIYSMANQSSVPNVSKDEKFDYEDEVSDENDDTGISLIKVRAEQGFSLRSFIDQINAKTKALAIARELDAQRGIMHQDATMSAGSIDSTTSTSTDAQRSQDPPQTFAKVRRIPSGARASTAEPNLGASTPMKDVSQNNNPHNQTINDLLVQSTPINTSKSAPTSRNAQPRDLLKEKFIENHKANSERSGELVHEEDLLETMQLHDEIEAYKKVHSEQEGKIRSLEQTVGKHEENASELRAQLHELQVRLKEQEELVANFQKSKNTDLEEHQRIIQDLRKYQEAIKSKEEEIFSMKEDTVQLRRERESINAENRAKLHEMQDVINAKGEYAQELEAKILSLQKHNEDLTMAVQKQVEEFDEFKARASDDQKQFEAQKKSWQGKLSEYEADLKTLRSANELLRSDLETQKKDFTAKVENNDSSLVSLRNENEQLRKELGLKTEELTTKSTSFENELTIVKEQVVELRLEKEKAVLRCSMLDTQHEESRKIRDGLEETNKGLKSVISRLENITTDQLQTIKRLEEEAKRKGEEEANSLASVKRISTQLEEKVRQLQEVVASKCSEIEVQNREREEFGKFLTGVSLFHLQVGDLISEQYRQEKYCCQIDSRFKSRNPNIVGFLTQEQNERTLSTATQLESAISEVQRLELSIKNEWESEVKALKDSLGSLESKGQQLVSSLSESASKITELESRSASLESERQAFFLEKEKYVKVQQDLHDQINELKTRLVEDQEKTFVELSSRIGSLNEEKLSLQEKVQSLNSLIKTKDSSLNEISALLSKERINSAASLDEVAQLRNELTNLKGKSSRKITFQLASQSRPHLSRKTYDSLMVDAVNDLDMIELQNIVKNLILLLEIPLSKITKKMPLVGIYLRYEKSICLHFANRLHYLIFHETIDIKRFTNLAYAQYVEHHDLCHLDHPLESCLDNLYKEVSARIPRSPITN